ncbi:MAG: 50S ribosomal protein L30 [Candidatus Aminicenantes bacterium]|nr:50S ribosomal protein L30 [Candidatus Aminicenantes bacterium]
MKKKKEVPFPQKWLKIKLIRSPIGFPKDQRATARGLGLRRLNSEVIKPDRPEIWGMIKKIPHLVKVEIVEDK